MTSDECARANAAIALAVGIGALASPRALLRLSGIAPEEVTGAAELGWRLFAARNLLVGASAWRGDASRATRSCRCRPSSSHS